LLRESPHREYSNLRPDANVNIVPLIDLEASGRMIALDGLLFLVLVVDKA
jgi:hypothetical protein